MGSSCQVFSLCARSLGWVVVTLNVGRNRLGAIRVRTVGYER
jgi:hypothetical protein